MAGKTKHAQRSMRSYKDSQYAFGGFKQFDRKISHVQKSPKLLALLIPRMLNSFHNKKQTNRQKAGVK